MLVPERDYRVLLRHCAEPANTDTPPRVFVATVSAMDMEGAKSEAEKLVRLLKGRVAVVKVEPR